MGREKNLALFSYPSLRGPTVAIIAYIGDIGLHATKNATISDFLENISILFFKKKLQAIKNGYFFSF